MQRLAIVKLTGHVAEQNLVTALVPSETACVPSLSPGSISRTAAWIFSAAKTGLLVAGGKLSSFTSNALKDVIDETVHDGHAIIGNTKIRVDHLHCVAVDARLVGVCALLGLLASLFGARGGLSRLPRRRLSRLLGGFLGRLRVGCLVHGRFFVVVSEERKKGGYSVSFCQRLVKVS